VLPGLRGLGFGQVRVNRHGHAHLSHDLSQVVDVEVQVPVMWSFRSASSLLISATVEPRTFTEITPALILCLN
jgi:hypothetical protein